MLTNRYKAEFMLKTQGGKSQPTETEQTPRCVRVCQNQSCLRQGSAEVLSVFQAAEVSDVTVEASGCLGQCSIGPTVRVTPDEIWYYRVQPSDVSVIVEQHLKGGQAVEEKLNPRIHRRFYG